MLNSKECVPAFAMAALLLYLAIPASAQLLQPVGVTTDTIGDYAPVENLISGIGLFGDDPQEHMIDTDFWVTDEVWPDGWFDVMPPVHLVFDFGELKWVKGTYIWAYPYSTGVEGTYQGNTMKDFSVRFGEGPIFSGDPVIAGTADHGPICDVTGSPSTPIPRQDFSMVYKVRARYAEVTITSNYFGEPGSRGGDRCGAGEIWFEEANINIASEPYPIDGAELVELDVTLSWTASQITDPVDPNALVPNPNLVKHVIYMSGGDPADPNVYLLDEVAAGDPVNERPEYGPLSLARDGVYYWRVDEVTDANTFTGEVWMFEAVPSKPIIDEDLPADMFISQGEDAVFTVDATNPYTGDKTGMSYQWYKIDVGGDIAVGDDSATYTISGATRTDEGRYYCTVTIIVEGLSGDSRAATLLTKRRIAYYPLDGNPDDLDGDADGTEVGSPTYDTGIVEGAQAIKLNGSTDYVTVPHTAFAWGPGWLNRSFSVSMWVNVSGGSGTYRAAISNRHEPPTQGFILYAQPDNNWNFWTGAGAGWYGLGGPSVENAEWAHLVITCQVTGLSGDSTYATKKIYLDGELASQEENHIYHPKDIESSDLFIGAGQNEIPANFYFPGLIDDVRIYNYAVDAFKVAQLYTDVMGGVVCAEAPAYDFDDDCEVTLSDFAILASGWMECNFVPVTACD
jgi:hypothetical protein